jgi:parallel beta-helix repeat protein
LNVKVSRIEQPSNFSNGNTLYVGGGGPGNYTNIQDAINDASDGDTVYVFDDSSPYKELLVIDKSISLIGEDRDTTIIDGDYKDTVVNIQADSVLVSGFTIIECKKQNNWQDNVIDIIGRENVIIRDNIISIGPEPWHNPSVGGIYLSGSSNNLIQDNVIFDNSGAGRTVGIAIFNDSSFNNISNNEVYGYTIGISSYLGNNVIYSNYIHHNCEGISNHGNSNKILNNIITNNSYEGIGNDNAVNTLISGNIINYNGNGGEFHNGIAFVLSSNNQVINNHISNNNPTGILLIDSNNNQIAENHIYNNNKMGIYVDFGYSNTISRNNLIYHLKNAYFDTGYIFFNRNTWDGNYYGDYSGGRYYLIRGTFYFLFFFSMPWINIDWHPASEPYDIEI